MNQPTFVQPPSASAQLPQPAADQAAAIQAAAHNPPDMSDTDEDGNEVCSLTFSRGDDVGEYLIDVREAATASMSGSTAPSDQKLISKAVQGCTNRERKLISGGRWKNSLSPAQALLAGAAGEEDNQFNLFSAAFLKIFKIFPSKSRAEQSEDFLLIKQTAIYAEWIPEYKTLYQKAVQQDLDMTGDDIHKIMHFINATDSNRLGEKNPTQVPRTRTDPGRADGQIPRE